MLSMDDIDNPSVVYNTQRQLQELMKLTSENITKKETLSRLTNLVRMSDYKYLQPDNNEENISWESGNYKISLTGANNTLVVVDSKRIHSESHTPVAMGMEQEVVRLGTFKSWPHNAPISASSLARAGFFYTCVDDKVQCFACSGQIKDWEYGDTAMGEHKKHFPKCPFVRDINYKNIPLETGATKSPSAEDRVLEKATGLFKASETKKGPGGKKAVGKLAKSSEFDENVKTQEGKPTRQPTIDSAEHETRLTFRSEYRRLLSFHSWPRTNPIEPRDLAKAGFYYLEKDDIVQCFACFGKIKAWEPYDVPVQEHARHFPSCPFVLGLDVKNEPITHLQTANAVSMNYREPSGFAPTLQQFRGQLEAALPQTAKVRSKWVESPSAARTLHQPKYPTYNGENARLATYELGWPGVEGITTNSLARAGFFYTGEGDNAKCFYCGGGLKNWEPTDEPWTEHAKWFPSCAWLQQQRGQAFVNYIVHNFPVDNQQLLRAQAQEGHDQTSSKQKSTPMAPPLAQSSNSPSASAAQEPELEAGLLLKKKGAEKQTSLEDAMRSRLTIRVIEMGYDENLVRRVIQHRLRTTGTEFPTTNDLLEAVWEAEENGGTEEAQAGVTGTVEKFTEEIPEKLGKNNRKSEGEISSLTRQLQDVKIEGSSARQAAGKRDRNHRVLEPQISANEIEQEIERLRDEKMCKVCMDAEANTVLMPCTHLVVCDLCANSLNVCPICRQPIRDVVRIYKS